MGILETLKDIRLNLGYKPYIHPTKNKAKVKSDGSTALLVLKSFIDENSEQFLWEKVENDDSMLFSPQLNAVIKEIRLDTDENTSYDEYCSIFKKKIKEQDKNLYSIKKNYHNCQVIYLVSNDTTNIFREMFDFTADGKQFGKVHLHFSDINFTSVIEESKANMLVWYTPKKALVMNDGYVPSVSFYYPSKMDLSKDNLFKSSAMRQK